MSAKGGLLVGADLTKVLSESNKHVICWTFVFNLERGSNLRRVRQEGVVMWENEFEQSGWGDNFFARAWLQDIDSEDIVELAETARQLLRTTASRYRWTVCTLTESTSPKLSLP